MDELDRIDRQIDIDASAERVWSLISRPGWWINTGRITPDQPVERRDGLDVVHHPDYGDFRIQTVDVDPPRYAAFRWLSDPDAEETGVSTLVEFWIDERPGGVTLRVAESGFATLSPDREHWLARREENVEGWEKELAVAREYVESGVGAR